MARKTALTALAVISGCLLAVAALHLPGPLTDLLICVACAIAGGMVFVLTPSSSGQRKVYRIRYHAPADPPDAQRLGNGFHLLAAYGGWVDLVWQRRAGALDLLIECSATSADWLPMLLNQLLPDVLLEPVSTPQAACSGICGRWPLLSGSDGVLLFFDAPHLLTDESLFVGDMEVRLHIAVEGGAVLIQGTPTRAAYQAGFRRWHGPRRILAGLRRHYRLWEPWPRAKPLPLHFPTTDGPGVETLDSRRSWVIPLPADYYPPPSASPRLYLGQALADGQPVEIIASETGEAAAAWRGHFGLLGNPAGTAATLTALIAGARARQVSVVHLHAARQRTRGAGPPGGDTYLIDLDALGVSQHWNLLMTTALSPGGAGSAALHLILTSHIPLLGAALAECGLVAASSGPGWTMLFDAAYLLTINYYRLQRTGDPGPFQPPSLRTVFDLLADPDGFSALAVHEAAQWATVDLGSPETEDEQPADEAIRPLVQELLRTVLTRLGTGDTAMRRHVAAGLRERLTPFVSHPRLVSWWDEPLTTPGAVLNSRPGTLIDIRFPAAGDDSTRLAVHRYGIYLLACLIALAAERVAAGHTHPPILLVLEEGTTWWRGSLLTDHLPLLAQASIAVLTTSPHLPTEPLGTRLLDTTGTWWLHTLDQADARRLEPLLRAWGVPAQLTLTGLPPGIALLKVAGRERPLVTTVRLTDPKEVP